LLLPPYVKLNF